MKSCKCSIGTFALLIGVFGHVSYCQETTKQTEQPQVHSRPCDGCKPAPPAAHITISCGHDDTAKASPADISSQTYSILDPGRGLIEWAPTSGDNRGWSVRFEKKSPCQKSVFSPQDDACEVKGLAGRYRYKLTLDGCAHSGRGTINVK